MNESPGNKFLYHFYSETKRMLFQKSNLYMIFTYDLKKYTNGKQAYPKICNLHFETRAIHTHMYNTHNKSDSAALVCIRKNQQASPGVFPYSRDKTQQAHPE